MPLDSWCGVIAMQGGLDVQIKWPNDIYYNGVKIGGALIHTTWAASTQQFCVLTGIGINVSNSQPTTCLDDIIQSKQQQQQVPQDQLQSTRVCKEQLLAGVLNHLESCFDTFQARGFDPLQPLYLSSWMHSNQVVELEEGADQVSAGASGLYPARRVPLTIVGLSPHGFLLAEDPLGQQYELTPDGNSLDMMQGLIKKKLH
jgi:biotin--protein ligase